MQSPNLKTNKFGIRRSSLKNKNDQKLTVQLSPQSQDRPQYVRRHHHKVMDLSQQK
jgi:hypothetical protein